MTPLQLSLSNAGVRRWEPASDVGLKRWSICESLVVPDRKSSIRRKSTRGRHQVSGLGDTVDKKAAAERWLQWVESFRGNKDVCFLFLDMLSLRGLQDIQVATYSKGNSSFNFIQRRLRRIH